MIRSRSLVTAVAVVLTVPVLGAAQREVDPAFDVVSVKPNVTVNPMAAIQLPPAGVNAVNVTPYLLIRYAFGLPDSQIVDVPEWAKRTRFDVSARHRPPQPTKTYARWYEHSCAIDSSW